MLFRSHRSRSCYFSLCEARQSPSTPPWAAAPAGSVRSARPSPPLLLQASGPRRPREGLRPGSSSRENSFAHAQSSLRPEARSRALEAEGLGTDQGVALPETTTPRRHRGAAAASTSLRHCRRPREAARAGAGAGADREPDAEDGGRPAAPRVRRPRGAPPRPGGAPPAPPRPAIVARDAEPGAAGGAARGERRGEGGCLLPSPSSPTGGPRQEFSSRSARPS